jgi:hypothetical protein
VAPARETTQNPKKSKRPDTVLTHLTIVFTGNGGGGARKVGCSEGSQAMPVYPSGKSGLEARWRFGKWTV